MKSASLDLLLAGINLIWNLNQEKSCKIIIKEAINKDHNKQFFNSNKMSHLGQIQSNNQL